jgi:hypothetical protein
MTPDERVASPHGGAVLEEDRPSLHTRGGCFLSRPTDRRGGFLLIDRGVILITGGLGLPATLRSRAILGAGQLIRVAVRPARARIIPEPTEALSLLRVGPDHQIPPTSDLPEMDVTLLHPILEPVGDPVVAVRYRTKIARAPASSARRSIGFSASIVTWHLGPSIEVLRAEGIAQQVQ